MIDHDQFFKELLSTFFIESPELFAPELTPAVNAGALVPLDSQRFSGGATSQVHVVDLLARFEQV